MQGLDKHSAIRLQSEIVLKGLELRSSAAANAIRVPGIINAAAIAVILSFLSNFKTDKAASEDLFWLIFSILYFLSGVIFSALAGAFAYWHQVEELNFNRSASISQTAPHVTFPEPESKRRRKLSPKFVDAARICVIISYIMFIVGSLKMYFSLQELFKIVVAG